MREFFKQQLETLQARTGIRQLEHLMAKDTWKDDVEQLIKFMIQECNRPPFHVVREDVKQRVIDRAIVEDVDFIGLSAKFVRKSLNAWWATNGDRVIEAMNAKETRVHERIELTPEQKEAIDVMANGYVARLLQGDGPRMIPKVDPEVAVEEGKEWKSDLERKAINYPVTSIEAARANELHREWVRQNFDKYTADKLPSWKEESEWIEGLSEEDKNQIYRKAKILKV